jgi:TonB family protein
MILDFLAANWMAWSLQVLILSSTACVAARLLRIAEPRSRLIGAQFALLACALFPLVTPRSPLSGGSVSLIFHDLDGQLGGRHLPPRSGDEWRKIVPVILVAGIAVRLLLLGAGMWKLRGYRKLARTLEPLPLPVTQAFALTGTRCRVAISDQIGGPAAFGCFDPMILLPEKFLELPDEAQRAIVCHELLHVRARDWLAAIAEEIAGALLWFQPAIYLLLADIRLAREKVVDRTAVALTRARTPYVHALLSVASEPIGATVSIAPLFLQRRNLKSRIIFLLEELSMSKTKLIYANFSLAVLLCGAGWVSAVSFPLVAAQNEPPAQKSEQQKAAPSADSYDFSKTFPPTTGKRIKIGGNIMSANLLSKVTPAYPPDAKAARIQGTVKLGILVGTDGNVHDLALISGNPALVPTASDAVRQWVYRPVLLNGDPVEAVSVVDVNFTLQK